MPKHDIKSDKIQVNTLLSEEQVRIIVENILAYNEAKALSGFDLVYYQYMVDFVSGAAFSVKSTVPVTGPITINWSGTVPEGGKTFAEKHGNSIHFQGYYTSGGFDISYMPNARITRDVGGNITQVEFADVTPGTIVII